MNTLQHPSALFLFSMLKPILTGLKRNGNLVFSYITIRKIDTTETVRFYFKKLKKRKSTLICKWSVLLKFSVLFPFVDLFWPATCIFYVFDKK